MTQRRREAPWWGLLATLLLTVLILYVVVGLSLALKQGWDRPVPADPYLTAQSATPVEQR
jgi:hypothetical protein